MGAISNHYEDVQNWVEKVIDSCETYDQARSARRLIWNFENQMVNNKDENGNSNPIDELVTFENTNALAR